jgi:hypothetical protein
LNDRIRNKFEKFAYFSGDIEVNISVSGTPFHYGKLMVSYQPYPDQNKALQANLNRVTVNPLFRPHLMMYLSQARSAKVIDVKDNQPVTIRIPFISFKPMWRLFNPANTELGSSSFVDFENSGTLFVYTLNQIGSVSASPSNVEMTIRANFVNVKLGTLTGTHYVVESDETKTGPVEKFFSGATNVVSKLNVIPEIAPLTVPTSKILGGLAGVSSYFGWSKPVLDENRTQMKPDAFNNGMVTSGNDTVKVMGVDKKRSLEVSQGMFGMSQDEMTLEYLCNRPSYFETFTWSPSDTPMSTDIRNYPVTPFYSKEINILQPYRHTTPLGFAANPFSYWRGDLVFTFQFVCSAYHRGKIAFIFEPNTHQTTAIGSDFNLNEQYMKIIDLQEVQNVTFCIPWASEYPWRRVEETFPPLSSSDSLNGRIYIVPYTTLQSPDDSSISINTYVHGKNMHFAVPNNNVAVDRSAYVAESEVATESSYFGFPSMCYELNESTASDDNIHMMNFGEKIASFRTLLKRYHYNILYSKAIPSQTYTFFQFRIYPEIYNSYGSSFNADANLLSYLRLAYLGMRGSVRHRIKFNGYLGNHTLDHINVELNVPKTGTPTQNVSETSVYKPLNFVGGVTYLTSVNGGVEVDLPFYTQNLWVFAQESNLVANTMDDYFIKDYSVQVPQYDNIATGTLVTCINEVASGEDFNLHYFLGAPPYNG